LKRGKPDLDEKRIVIAEFVLAFGLLSIVAFVLYAILSYTPAAG
jgi:hypothetical protein